MEAAVSETAGSVAASESHSSGQQAEESLAQQGGSVNWGQATAQSPRVPRSQISRAHPAAAAGAYGERTSAVLSALSADDETALSAAEAAGEHTSEPQEAVGGMPALSLTAPGPRGRGGFELASSPPASTSPIYRANSVVSYTAGPPPGKHGAQQGQQVMGPPRRGADTPASAPAAAQLPGSSPNTSRGEFPALQRGQRRGGGLSAGLPPTSGQRPGSGHIHFPQPAAAAAGPSRPSLSGTQSHAAAAAAPALSLPSTMAVALGALSPPGGALLAQLTPTHGTLALPTPPPPAAAGLAGLFPLAASIGLQPSQLGSMAAALLQAQSSALGTQQQHSAQVQQPSGQQPAAAGKAAPDPRASAGGAPVNGMPPPPPAPPLQVLQQAEALQSMAAMLQAQASAIMNGTPPAAPPAGGVLQQQGQGQAADLAAVSPAGGAVSPAAAAAAAAAPSSGQHQQQGAAAPLASEAGHPQPAASLGAASVQSLPSLVGASAIQGHPLPPPTAYRTGGATTPPPLQSFGGTPGPYAAAAAAPLTVESGAFPAPRPLAAATPHQMAAAVSDVQGSAIQPALAAQAQPAAQQAEQPAAGSGLDATAEAMAAPQQQAASAVLGSGHAAGSPRPFSRSFDLDPAAAEAERRRYAGEPPQPQAATIQELPTADVAAASQGGGTDGGRATPGPPLPPARPQEAAMLGGNSAFGDAMELGADDDGEQMEVEQEAAGGQAGRRDLPPAPHGAASVMATLMTDDDGGGPSEGGAEMEQQAASGPSRTPAAVQPAQSLSRSMAEPAAATAHITGAPSAVTAPSQQGPATSNHGQVAHALSSLATMSTGNGERAGGSVEMSALPSLHQAQHATSAPAVMPAGAGPPPHCGGPAAALGAAGREALSPVPGAAGQHPPGATAKPAASAPAAVPPQQPPLQPGAAGPSAAGAARPAASASMSGQGDTPDLVLLNGSAAGPALPQSSAAVPPPAAAQQAAHMQQAQQAEAAASQPPQGGAAPALASLCMGQNDGGEPMTDARSRRERGGATGPPAPARATMEGMGSPDASMHAAPRESQGTARATILAGATHSILTTAAAGEGEAMDEGGEALSPLLACKAAHMHAAAVASRAAALAGAAPAAAAALPGSGSVGGTPPPAASALTAGDAAAARPTANGVAKHSSGRAAGPAGGGATSRSQGCASPIDFSTMAVDLAPPANGTEHPQPSASFQPSGLPPAAAVAAALAALEQQQAALNGSLLQTPPQVPPELGELYQALQQQNGHATYANSAIGNGHIASASPERELTSPSRLRTHDSTGSGSRQRTGSKQTAKRRRTSAARASSSQQA
ncbi:hypothetical protein ABPG77_005667 [Micractinium sp. CCAP 211/92]